MGKHKLRLLYISIIAILFTFMSQEALIYYTTLGNASNVITSGDIQFMIHEKTDQGTAFPTEGVYIVPGDIVSKQVSIESLCAHPFYLRVKLVGGSTKMPQVKARVREEFPGIEVMMYDPDEAVAKGAALYAHNKDQTKIILEMVAAEKNVSTEEAERIVAEAAQTGNKRLLGSSVEEKLAQQGLSIAKTINIVNVTSRSFGIVALNEREQRRLFNLICKNDELPASCTEEFFTVAANQTNVLLEVYESLSSDKEVDPEMGKLLGTATMDLPSGLPQGSPLEVSFTLNESGLLEMTARELSANRRCDARFDVKGAISAEEVAAAKSRNLASTVE